MLCSVDSWFEHLAEKPGPGWTALSETVHVSWLDGDDREHEKTLTDGREACDLIEAILGDEDLLLTGCKHRSRCEIVEGPRRVRVQSHACTMVGLYAEFAAGTGDGSGDDRSGCAGVLSSVTSPGAMPLRSGLSRSSLTASR